VHDYHVTRTVHLCSQACKSAFDGKKHTACTSGVIVGIVGKSRAVTTEEGLALGEKYGCPYFEVDLDSKSGVIEWLNSMVMNSLPAITTKPPVQPLKVQLKTAGKAKAL
jgi:hypothetical protein